MTALLVETVMTVFFVMVVLMTTMEEKTPIHPVVIGLTFAVDVIIG